jgi:hypothetical protein
VQRSARDRAEVVVLEDQRLGVLGDHVAELTRPLGIESGAGRVLAPRRQHGGAGAPREGGPKALGDHAAPVDGNRLEPKALRAQEVEQGCVPGALDGDPVAGTEPGRQRALDPVERSAHDAQPLGGDPVGCERPARGGEQRRELQRLSVEMRRDVDPAQRGGEVGEERRVRVPTGEVAHPLGHGERVPPAGPRHGRALADSRPPARLGDDDATAAQLTEPGSDGGRADAGVGGEPPDGRQPLPRREAPVGDRRFELGNERGSAARCDPILCCHRHHAVLLQIFSI